MFSCILTDKLPKQESIRLNSPINWLGFEESQILHGKESYRTLKSIHLFQFQMNNKKEYIELNQELTFVSMNLGLVFNPIERKRENAKFFFLSEIRQGNISLPKKKKKKNQLLYFQKATHDLCPVNKTPTKLLLNLGFSERVFPRSSPEMKPQRSTVKGGGTDADSRGHVGCYINHNTSVPQDEQGPQIQFLQASKSQYFSREGTSVSNPVWSKMGEKKKYLKFF